MLVKTNYIFGAAEWELLWPMVVGGTAVIAQGGAERDPQRMLSLLSEAEISHVLLVPTALAAICDMAARVGFGSHGVPPLKHVLLIGEALPPSTLVSAQQLLPRTTFHNLYGPTEANFTAYPCPRISRSGSMGGMRDALAGIFACCSRAARQGRPLRIPVGRACANTAVYIVDEQLRLVPVGEVGEVCIGGTDAVADGYLGMDELSRTKFVADPFRGQGTRMYRTGDRGRWNHAGQIEFFGRADRQVSAVSCSDEASGRMPHS